MFFKLTNRNPYRDFVRNARRVAISTLSDLEKITAYKDLYKLLQPKLIENTSMLYNSPAFSDKITHWNQLDNNSIVPTKNNKNPWLLFKRQYEKAINSNSTELISRELAWFYSDSYKDDWIAD